MTELKSLTSLSGFHYQQALKQIGKHILDYTQKLRTSVAEGTGCFRSLRIDFTETDHCSGYSSDRNVSISRDQSNKHAAPVGGGQRNTDQNGGFPDSCSLHESILSDEYLVPVEENVVKKIPVFDEEPHHRMTQYCDTNAMFSQNPLAEEHKTNAPPAGPPRPPMMN